MLILHFNSIKVRLEHSDNAVMQVDNEFQFHKGAIRTFCSTLSFGCIELFQFHKGAIRTRASAAVLLSFVSFQFHKGAIRTVRDMVKRYNSAHFNSIKVRLELWDQAKNAEQQTFQFHKGAIRTPRWSWHKLHTQTFQFHKGAIRTFQISNIRLLYLISIP